MGQLNKINGEDNMEELFDYEKAGDYIIIDGFKEGQFVEDVVIPAQIEGCRVLILGYGAFSELDIKSVSLPNTIIGMDRRCFNNCKKLEQVTSRKADVEISTLINEKDLKVWAGEYGLIRIKVMALTNCFNNCNSLKYVDLSETYISRFTASFCNNNSLETIIYPKNNFSNELSFLYFEDERLDFPKLRKVVFPNLNIELLMEGGNIFRNAPNLKEVELPFNSRIYDEPFGSQTKLINPEKFEDKRAYGKTIVNWFYQDVVEYITPIPFYDWEIRNRTFEGHQTLKSVIINSNVAGINDYAFSNCPNLERIEIEEGAATIKDTVIEGSNNIKEIIVPSIGYLIKSTGLFNNNAKIIIKDKNIDTASWSWKYRDYSTHKSYSAKRMLSIIVSKNASNIYEAINETGLFNKIGHNTKDFVEIFKTAIDKDYIEIMETFAKNEKIHPNRINEYIEHAKSVGANRSLIFLSKWKNENVDLEKERKAIATKTKRMMQDPDAILRKTYTFRNHEEYGLGLRFKDKELLNEKRITLPSKYKGQDITYLTDKIFKFNQHLEEVVLPDKLLHIGEEAFYGCTNLAEVRIPSSVINIGMGAFVACDNLKEVMIPSSVINVEKNAFNNCKSLKKVRLTGGNNIGQGAFLGCNELEEIIFENKSIENIDSYAFSHTQIKKIEWPSTVDVIEVGMFSESTLEEIIISDNVKSIGSNAFLGTKIKEFEWPSSVDVIENNMFSESTLERIKIPENVISIEYRAFKNCNNLKEIYIPKSVKSFGFGILNGCPNVVIHVEKDSEAHRFAMELYINYKII